jgi:Ca2+-binding EF-hand superfamily protein
MSVIQQGRFEYNSGDGTVSKEEFREWIKELMTILKDPQKSLDLALQVMFKACDIDGNGKLSRKEFR